MAIKGNEIYQFDVLARLVSEPKTGKSYAVLTAAGGRVYLPKSRVERTDLTGGVVRFSIPGWLVKSNAIGHINVFREVKPAPVASEMPPVAPEMVGFAGQPDLAYEYYSQTGQSPYATSRDQMEQDIADAEYWKHTCSRLGW